MTTSTDGLKRTRDNRSEGYGNEFRKHAAQHVPVLVSEQTSKSEFMDFGNDPAMSLQSSPARQQREQSCARWHRLQSQPT